MHFSLQALTGCRNVTGLESAGGDLQGLKTRQDLNRLFGTLPPPQPNVLPRQGQGMPAGMPQAPKQPFMPSMQQPLQPPPQQNQVTQEALQQLRMTLNHTAQLQMLEALLSQKNLSMDGLAALGAALNSQTQAQAGMLGWQAAQQAQQAQHAQPRSSQPLQVHANSRTTCHMPPAMASAGAARQARKQLITASRCVEASVGILALRLLATQHLQIFPGNLSRHCWSRDWLEAQTGPSS